jgi:hypothetical protein
VGLFVHKFVRPKNSEERQMIEDPIVAEVRRHRKEHAAEHGNDLKRIVEALRKRYVHSRLHQIHYTISQIQTSLNSSLP